VINPTLVRGLDYYNRTVFEWVTTELGAQGTICAGGRYDGLVAQLGGQATQGCGFAMGLERIILLLEQQSNFESKLSASVDVYICGLGEKAEAFATQYSEQLRDSAPQVKVQMHCGGGNFKKQLKKADRSGAQIALIIGDDEVSNQSVAVKYLRQDKPQETMDSSDLLVSIGEILN